MANLLSFLGDVGRTVSNAWEDLTPWEEERERKRKQPARPLNVSNRPNQGIPLQVNNAPVQPQFSDLQNASRNPQPQASPTLNIADMSRKSVLNKARADAQIKALEAKQKQSEADIFNPLKILGDVANAGGQALNSAKNFGTDIVAGIQQGAADVADKAVMGGNLLEDTAAAIRGDSQDERNDIYKRYEDVRNFIKSGKNIKGESLVPQADFQFTGDVGRDAADLAGRSLNTGMNATMFVNPSRLFANGALRQGGKETLKMAGRDALFFGGLAGSATTTAEYARTGDFGESLKTGLKNGLINGASAGVLDVGANSLGSGMRRGVSSTSTGLQTTAKVVNEARPSVMADNDPRVAGFNDHMAQLQQSFDTTTDPVARQQINKAITTTRIQQNVVRNRVKREMNEGGYHYNPLNRREALSPVDDNSSQFIQREAANYNNPDELIDELSDEIYKSNRGGAGTVIARADDLGRDGVRISENTPFYQEYYKQNGKKPTKEAVREMVSKYLDGDNNAVRYELPPETRGIADALKQRIQERQISEAKQVKVPGNDEAKFVDANNQFDEAARLSEAGQPPRIESSLARPSIPDNTPSITPEQPAAWYHGTNAVFDKFDQSKIGSTTDDGLYGRGFYFANDKNYAKNAPRGGAKHVMEVDAGVKNPLDVSKFKSIEEAADYLDMSELALTKDADGFVRPKYDQIGQFTSHVKDRGHDGVYVPYSKNGGKGDELVAFNAEGIKKIEAKAKPATGQKSQKLSPEESLALGGSNPKAAGGISPSINSEIVQSRKQQMSQRLEDQRKSGALPTKASKLGKTENPSSDRSLSNSTTIKPVVKGGAKKLPVRNLTREGDVVTSTNVNPKVKAGEKRYSVDDEGKMIEDSKGATRLFTQPDGKVKGFRIGKEYFDAKDLGDLSTVNGYGSTVATMRRNAERAFDRPTGEKVSKFLVDHQQGQATKMIERQLNLKNEMKALADDLGISFAVGRGKAKKVSAAIQDFGEGVRDKQSLVDEFGADQANKVIKADKWFRQNYDSMLDEMNDTLTQYGYDPVPKRKNYYTHFQDETVWRKFGLKMNEIRDLASPTMQDANPSGVRGAIDNKLAGQSEFAKPNKGFNRFALQRKGAKHTADAFKAFETYLNPTLNNIYMTPSIARARVISRAIAQDANIAGKDANKTIIQLQEWANSLSGKSSRIGDRFMADTTFGPQAMKVMSYLQKQTGQNSIVGNLSTAVMQPIVLTQTAGKFGYKNTMLGLLQEMTGSNNTAKKTSPFLKRRYSDVTPVTSGKLDKAREIANTPLQVVERGATESTWNAAYNEARSRGLKGQAAVREADINTEKTVAGRSVGEKPELYRSKSAGLATMFQLEVNNYWQQVGKEMTKSQVAKTMVAAYGFNLLLQQVTGRQVGFNPVDAAIDSYDEATKDRPLVDKARRIGQRWVGEVVDNSPVVGMAATTLFGEENVKDWTGDDSNTGRFGSSSPVKTVIENPWMLASPLAGGQIKKTAEAAPVLMEGKLKDKDGKTLVDVPQTPANIAKGLLFGKGAIPEVNQYYNNLGKDKIDQKAVQNQKISKAANQSLEGLTKKQQEELATATDERKASLRAEYIAQNQAKAKAEAAGLKVTTLGEKKTGSTERKSTYKVSDKVDGSTKSILSTYYGMKADKRESWLGEKNDNEYKYYKAKYENDKAEGKISKIEDVSRKRFLAKDKVGAKYSKDTRDLYSMSKADIATYLSTAKNGEKLGNELLAYDRKLYDAGLTKYMKFKYGLGSSTGRRSGGRRGGGRKGSGKAGANATAKAMASLQTQMNKIRAPSSSGSKYNGGSIKAPVMKKAVVKRYTVKNNKVSSKPLKITSRKA